MPEGEKFKFLIEEYKEVGQNMRFYGNLRFAQMSLFSLLSSGLISIVFRPDNSLPLSLKWILKVLGMMLVILFYIIEKRSTKFWEHYRDRALELQKTDLPCRQYSNLPKRRCWLDSATNAASIIYLSVLMFWIISLLF